MVIQQDDSYKFKFNNDYGLHNALRAITEKSRLEIKLMKMHGKFYSAITNDTLISS